MIKTLSRGLMHDLRKMEDIPGMFSENHVFFSLGYNVLYFIQDVSKRALRL
jgi:hypothetical protein